jgi:hypothetical protein
MAEEDDKPEVEYSKSGQPVYRHKARNDDLELAPGDEATIAAVSDHVERHVGPVAWVFHELISDKVHLDVHVVEPGEGRPFYTLVTSGMSERPMTMPPDSVSPPFAELVVCLPPDWKVSQEAFADENNYWPVRWLKTIARLPHDYRTWLGYGHTVPHGDPPEPYAENTRFCCLLLLRPTKFGADFHILEGPDGKRTAFYVLVPLYPEEVTFKLAKGTEPLEELFRTHGVTEVIDLTRVNVCGRNQRKSRKEFN